MPPEQFTRARQNEDTETVQHLILFGDKVLMHSSDKNRHLW
nr:MAG TPA: hypothetical protein [Caudoviricetes sp.]DAW13858.1 MAG TPA: hypothetical protein [Caudoviricetes sp.]